MGLSGSCITFSLLKSRMFQLLFSYSSPEFSFFNRCQTLRVGRKECRGFCEKGGVQELFIQLLTSWKAIISMIRGEKRAHVWNCWIANTSQGWSYWILALDIQKNGLGRQGADISRKRTSKPSKPLKPLPPPLFFHPDHGGDQTRVLGIRPDRGGRPRFWHLEKHTSTKKT